MQRTLSAVTVALGIFVAASAVVDAQVGYFGQNKVQYRTFTLSTRWIRLTFKSRASDCRLPGLQIADSRIVDCRVPIGIADCRLDWRLPIEIADCRLRLPIADWIGDWRLPIEIADWRVRLAIDDGPLKRGA